MKHRTDDAREPAWPTAPLVWWDGRTWERYDEWGYKGVGAYWRKAHLSGSPSDIRDKARRFACEAVPVTIVPTAEWEALRQCVEAEESVWDAAESLVSATRTAPGLPTVRGSVILVHEALGERCDPPVSATHDGDIERPWVPERKICGTFWLSDADIARWQAVTVIPQGPVISNG